MFDSQACAYDVVGQVQRKSLRTGFHQKASVSAKPFWYHFGIFGAPPILGPILVVGLNRMFFLVARLDFDPWIYV